MSNLHTLGDAVSACARFVENGSGGCDRDTVVDRINEACGRAMAKGDWPHTTVVVRARVDRATFPLPEELETIRAVAIDNEASAVNSPYFRFMSAGPGEERSWFGTGAKSVDEMGMFPTMYDVPSIETPGTGSEASRTFSSDGLKIAAFSSAEADAGKIVQVSGFGKYDAELSSSATEHRPLEPIAINQWDGSEGAILGGLAGKVATSNLYRQVSEWSKPETAGYVSLYAVDQATSRMWFLAKAHPFTTHPSWRRFRFRGQNCSGSNVLIYGKLASRTLRSDDDILPIQNIPALKMLVQAIEFENRQQLQQAVEYEAQAIRLLSEQKANHDGTGFQVDVIDHDVALHGASFSRYVSR